MSNGFASNALHSREQSSVWLGLVLWIGCSILYADDQGIAFFESRIRPVLIEHCYECHSLQSSEAKGGLSLDSRQGVQQGGDSGALLDLEQVDKSLLLNALRHQDFQMPPKSKLPDAVIDDFRKWIEMGAPDPRDETSVQPKTTSIDWEQAQKHWAFQPRSAALTPPPSSDWAIEPLDAFIEAKRSSLDLTPNPAVARTTWLRRIHFDLVGVPPTIEEMESFVQSEEPDCYEQVVDRLLASPEYGERWGRYWLDLARYADSNGADENHAYPVAWRYRDYVIQSLNADIPFDQFVTEQLAGDLLEPVHEEAEQRRRLTATGFLVLGPKMLAEQDKPKLVADLVDEQIDTVGKVFMGLTLGCARCHDHKFDPIQAQDYYALAGIFYSTKSMEHLNHVAQWNERELPNTELRNAIANHQQQLQTATAELSQLKRTTMDQAIETQLSSLSQEMKNHAEKLQKVRSALPPLSSETEETIDSSLLRLRNIWIEVRDAARDANNKITDAAKAKLYEQVFGEGGLLRYPDKIEEWLPDSQRETYVQLAARVKHLEQTLPTIAKAMAVEDAPVKLVAVHVRGNHLQTAGEPLPREVPRVLRGRDTDWMPVFPSDRSGRLELARWLTHPSNPLTARVIVNRLWQGHFGDGLVASASNFGVKGQAPTHPELLDWLANELTRRGWSLKSMHRSMVLSSTYRMSSELDTEAAVKDPSNQAYWRQTRHRLEAETLRDALLAVGGVLERRMGGSSQAAHAPTSPSLPGVAQIGNTRRTIYLDINRAAMNDFLATFDYVEPGTSVDRRPSTTVPHQALFLMNHAMPMEIGHRIAKQACERTSDSGERLRWIVQTVLQREPTSAELATLQKFLLGTSGNASTGSPTAEVSFDKWVDVCRSLLLTNEFLYVE